MVKLDPKYTKKETVPAPSAPKPPKGFPWGWTIVGMVIVVVLVAALATLPFWGELTGKKTAEPAPENTISFGSSPANSEEGAAETTEPEILPSDVTLIVLNGTTTAGAAGKLKAKLEEEGYVVNKAANADNFRYAQTLVRYPAGKDKEAKLVQDSVVKDGYDALLEEAEVDIITVIIGKT